MGPLNATTKLIPMREEQFSTFVEEAIANYAHDNVTAGRWPERQALGNSRSEFERLLPNGLSTPDNYLYEIWDEALGAAVGFLWFAVLGTEDARFGFIYNIRVRPEFRGRGHAATALALIEDVAEKMGLRSVALHVFAFNSAAQALYRSAGFGITGYNMRKPLRRNDA